MPFTAWKHEERQTQRQTNVFNKTSGGCVIAVRDNSFIDSKQHFLEPTYLVTILKALMPVLEGAIQELCSFDATFFCSLGI